VFLSNNANLFYRVSLPDCKEAIYRVDFLKDLELNICESQILGAANKGARLDSKFSLKQPEKDLGSVTQLAKISSLAGNLAGKALNTMKRYSKKVCEFETSAVGYIGNSYVYEKIIDGREFSALIINLGVEIRVIILKDAREIFNKTLNFEIESLV